MRKLWEMDPFEHLYSGWAAIEARDWVRTAPFLGHPHLDRTEFFRPHPGPR